ncbi:Non-reducing polyketide synthase, partial [Frankliniella fusca]
MTFVLVYYGQKSATTDVTLNSRKLFAYAKKRIATWCGSWISVLVIEYTEPLMPTVHHSMETKRRSRAEWKSVSTALRYLHSFGINVVIKVHKSICHFLSSLSVSEVLCY